jgi:hypothetical protein
VGFAACALISFALLTMALKKLEAGSAYAVWTGLGAAGTALVGIWALGESASPVKLVSIGLILAGVIGLNLAGVTPVSTALTGLSQAEVRKRVLAGQVNTPPTAPGRTVGQILRANVLTRFNAILGILFVVVLIVGPPQDALFGVVLAVNTGIGVAQELRAKRALDKLAILTAAQARVLRDGAIADIAQDEVVLDDVLELRRGDQVPVDASVVQAEGLELDEALLTGEAEPTRKRAGDTLLSGSFVVAGTGQVRVTAVGGQSYAAGLQAQARRFSLIRSELHQGINQILRLVTWVMIPAGILLIASEFFRSHQPLAEAIRGSAAGVSAMVPGGPGAADLGTTLIWPSPGRYRMNAMDTGWYVSNSDCAIRPWRGLWARVRGTLRRKHSRPGRLAG